MAQTVDGSNRKIEREVSVTILVVVILVVVIVVVVVAIVQRVGKGANFVVVLLFCFSIYSTPYIVTLLVVLFTTTRNLSLRGHNTVVALSIVIMLR